jgi:plastocyanin
MRFTHILLLLLMSVALLGAAVACGDDDDDESDGNGGTTTTRPTATEDEADATPEVTEDAQGTPGATADATGAAGDEVQVTASDFLFSPASFTVPAGQPVKVEVTNAGSAPHTLTVYSDGAFTSTISGADTEQIESSEDADFTTTFEAGNYFFRCEVHPSAMQGTITAQ